MIRAVAAARFAASLLAGCLTAPEPSATAATSPLSSTVAMSD